MNEHIDHSDEASLSHSFSIYSACSHKVMTRAADGIPKATGTTQKTQFPMSGRDAEPRKLEENEAERRQASSQLACSMLWASCTDELDGKERLRQDPSAPED
jgi:hypothetical protein